ncbi:MAG: ComEC/Rec2 family competence protein [Oligoflexales bacterium]|nr:ComEC/Rec2 family competence protein [Oligoflexales bacterium]
MVIGSSFWKKKELSFDLKYSFKETGLYHILAVSGMNVSILAFCSMWCLVFPLRIFYSLKIISPNYFIILHNIIKYLVILILLEYTALTGFSPSCQRAFLIYGFFLVLPIILGSSSLNLRLKITATIQILIFPIDFINLSNILSWGSYIIFVAGCAEGLFEKENFLGKLVVLTRIQIMLMLFSTAFVNQVSLIGLFTNLAISPIFPIIFILSIAVVFFGSFVKIRFLCDISLYIVNSFLYLIENLAIINGKYFGENLRFDNTFSGVIVMVALRIAAILCILQSMKLLMNKDKFAE